MKVVALPGVYRPRSDSELLVETLAEAPLGHRLRALDLCTGSGIVAVSLAAHGHEVVAVDVGRRAIVSTRLNAALNRVKVDARRGDLFGAVEGERFDVIVANPPYVPCPPDAARSRASRAWDAGDDGREIVDRICREAAAHLHPGGSLFLMQSSLADVDATLRALPAEGFAGASVVARHRGPLGPIASARADYLAARGHDRDADEELVVICATREDQAPVASRRARSVQATLRPTAAA